MNLTHVHMNMLSTQCIYIVHLFTKKSKITSELKGTLISSWQAGKQQKQKTVSKLPPGISECILLHLGGNSAILPLTEKTTESMDDFKLYMCLYF